MAATGDGRPLLEVEGLTTHFFTPDGVVRAVEGATWDVREGETIGLVGESGSGKSVTALSIMRLLPDPPGRIVGGRVLFNGRDLLGLSQEEMRRVRGKEIAMIFQEPMTSLNPVLTISRQLTEALELHLKMDRRSAKARAVELLQRVGIPDAHRRVNDYPHRFSGGMLQRVMIAMALSCNPKLIIADEPTTALDMTIQAQVLELVTEMAAVRRTAIVLITHNLGVVARHAARVNVMYAGRIVESAAAADLYGDPRHPYTLGLLQSIPRLDEPKRTRLAPIEGSPPDLLNLPPGCPFRPRCRFAVQQCAEAEPPLLPVAPGRRSACWVAAGGREFA